jgi:hypothetical protein
VDEGEQGLRVRGSMTRDIEDPGVGQRGTGTRDRGNQ